MNQARVLPLAILVLLGLLALASCSFCAFGDSRITIHRSWLIQGADGEEIDFTGALVLNNTHQRVLSLSVSPGAYLESQESPESPDGGSVTDGWAVKVRYKGRMNGTSLLINSTAIVDVDYGTSLTSDPPLPRAERPFTNLTQPDDEIRAAARNLAVDGSSLETIRNITSWVYSAMKYDVSYWGVVSPATEVFRDRRGVCVEYTHLLISLARSAGFDTRYVSGYVYANAWQPHAWAEIYVPGYGWLPADATFSQVGTLDGTHLAIVSGNDQSSAYDLLLSDSGATITARDNVTTDFLSNNTRGVDVTMHADNHTYTVAVEVANTRPEYVFGTYTFLPARTYAEPESGLVLLAPNEIMRKQYVINSSLFDEGYTYALPLSASFNDAKADQEMVVSRPPQDTAQAGAGQCGAPSAILLLVLLPASLRRPECR